MQIRYTLTAHDIAAMRLHMRMGTPGYRRLLRLLLVIVGVVVIAESLVIIDDISHVNIMKAVAFGVAVVIVAIFMDRIFALKPFSAVLKGSATLAVRRALEGGGNRALLGQQRMTIGEAGIEIENDMMHTTISWRGVEKVERTGEHIFIILGSLSAYVIPKRAFGAGHEADAFFEAAHDYHERLGA
jgi:hypothetical protein